jgi:hypothetical protein
MNRLLSSPVSALGLAVLPLVVLFLALASAARAQPVGPPLAPGLTAGVPDNCLGSSSGSLGTLTAALSFGSTHESAECNRRADARLLAAMGDLAAAQERMCDSPKVREARRASGRPCAADGGPPASPAPAAAPPPRAGELAVRPIDVCSTLSTPAERRAYARVCRRS